MQFSLKSLFILTTGVALWVWLATIFQAVAIAGAFFLLPAASIGAALVVDVLWDASNKRGGNRARH